jgi:hypothetical protein
MLGIDLFFATHNQSHILIWYANYFYVMTKYSQRRIES